MQVLTVNTDSREVDRLPFPENILVHLRRSKKKTLIRLRHRKIKLDAGDYCMDTFGRSMIVETKRSADEVANNFLTHDFRRADSAFSRLGNATIRPILVCEFSQSDLFNHKDHPRLLDALAWGIVHYRLQVWFAGPRHAKDARRKTAEAVLRMMIAAVEIDHPNFLHNAGGGDNEG